MADSILNAKKLEKFRYVSSNQETPESLPNRVELYVKIAVKFNINGDEKPSMLG